MIDWHRALGITLTWQFHDTRWRVEIEKDLALKAQRLDVLVVRKMKGPDLRPRPDGLENMADHNLITYKSLREPLDDWSLKELTGHYVNYRKLVSPPSGELLHESGFRLYAVSTRNPRKLRRQVELVRRGAGVYDVRRGTDEIRLIVLNELPRASHNAPWLLFSGVAASVKFGREHLRFDTDEMSAVLQDLLSLYRAENIAVSYTVEDFRKELATRLTKEELSQSPVVQEIQEHAEWVGKIHLCQQMLGEPLTPRSELLQKSNKQLQAMAEELAQQVANR